jgi:tetratricopeptide (TPR) repeat protein
MQYRLATRRFEQVRQIARFVAYPIYDAVAALPGSTSARKLILSKMLEYLDNLSPEAARDQPLQFEIGEAYARLADVQGNPGQPNLGDRLGAIANYRKSYALYRNILRQSPQNSRAIAGLADVCRRLAVVLASARQIEDLLKARPEDAGRQRNVALVNKYIAARLLVRSEKDRGLPYLNRAEELDAARAAANPEAREAQMDLSFDYSQNATFYSNRERFEEALANYRKALDIRLRIAKADPADAHMQDRLVFVYSRIGGALENLGRPAEALTAYKEAVRISRELLTREPRHPPFRLNLASSLADEARLKPDACGTWQEAAGLYGEMVRDRQLRDSEREKMEQVVTRVRACGG